MSFCKASSSFPYIRLVQPVQVNRNCVHASVKRAIQHFNDRKIPVCHIIYTCVSGDKFTWGKSSALHTFYLSSRNVSLVRYNSWISHICIDTSVYRFSFLNLGIIIVLSKLICIKLAEQPSL